MDDFRRLHDRLDRAFARAGDPRAVAEINDALSEGYAEALLAEAELIALEERLADQIAGLGAGRAEAVRTLALEHRAAEQAVAHLRARLADLRERFVVLGGATRPGLSDAA